MKGRQATAIRTVIRQRYRANLIPSRLPITLKVAVSPILYIPQTTERKIIGPATAFKKPRKQLRSGTMTPSRNNDCAVSGISLTRVPQIIAETIAISSFCHSGIFFFCGSNTTTLAPFL